MTKFKLGLDLSFAKKRWPEPEAWLEIVREGFGLEYVEFDSGFLDPLYISEPARSEIALEIRKLADEHKITIHNYFTGTRLTLLPSVNFGPDECTVTISKRSSSSFSQGIPVPQANVVLTQIP